MQHIQKGFVMNQVEIVTAGAFAFLGIVVQHSTCNSYVSYACSMHGCMDAAELHESSPALSAFPSLAL